MRLDYQHRWLGNIIEDGYGPGFQNGVLANPGNVPQSALDAAQHTLDQAQVTAAALPNDPAAQAAAATAQYNLGTLQTLANAPAPERTYDAITLSVNKRFAKNWLTRASYTYSRLIGNYEGLYQQETNYIAPNGGNAYDAPELYVNQNGPLPNDRPHLFQARRLLSPRARQGAVTFGLSFTARSGMPRNYIGNLQPGTALPDRHAAAAGRRRAHADHHPAQREDRLRPAPGQQDEHSRGSSTSSTSSTSRRRS